MVPFGVPYLFVVHIGRARLLALYIREWFVAFVELRDDTKADTCPVTATNKLDQHRTGSGFPAKPLCPLVACFR
jgi:hypothetical protein